MLKARIFRPDKNAMQSGKAGMKYWLFEYVPGQPYSIDNLMGWNGLGDMTQEIYLSFPTKEAAIAYAKKHRIPYEVHEPNKRRPVKKAYADNFRYNKVG